jgi:Holliday junction resolvase RusA-like endonuclease
MVETARMTGVSFTVYGEAVPSGSKTIGRSPNGKTWIRAANDRKQRPWMQSVAGAAAQAMNDGPLLEGPLLLDVTFYRSRPKGHYRTNGELSAVGLRNPYPATRPDLTKTVRALEDAMLGIVFREDSQICEQRNRKLWGEPIRAEVIVFPLPVKLSTVAIGLAGPVGGIADG